jgi:putative glutamine amidotransferase
MIRVALPFGKTTPESKKDFYRNALRNAGVEPVEDVASLDGLSGLVLAGGTDVAPELYGATRGPETQEPDVARDERESALIKEALQRDLPVLAICRGMQLLNVVMGGTLMQHIDGHRVEERDAHTIEIERGSRLEGILGADHYVVNSRHHQVVDRVGVGLVIAAKAPDGVIEALEIPAKRFMLAVQWHPESRVDGDDRKLFSAFQGELRSP